ncbi:MAG: DUF559 domain-containing protein [Candidatus Binatia bacterium]|jgi:very-short-patch-repair endonuclease
MLKYEARLKEPARLLRNQPTDSERRLWSRVRRRQILDLQFYRQKPIGSYIVDFYAPAVGLVVEVDGAQHFEPIQTSNDRARTGFLESHGLRVLRFTNTEVLKNLDTVLQAIYVAVADARERLRAQRRGR